MKFIARCTPSLGMVSLWWARMAESILPVNNMAKALFCARDKVGGEIAEARNYLVSEVLRYDDEERERGGEVTHIAWLDDDVLCMKGWIVQLYSHGRDIASGAYFLKQDPSLPLIYPEKMGGADAFRPNRAYDVWGHGMGLCLIKLDVYRRLLPELPKDRYGRPAWYATTHGREFREDERGVVHTGNTEDLHFLDLCARAGYKPLVDTSKHTFGFHYDAREDIGYPLEQWRQWVAGEPITWNTPDGPVVWD